MSCRHARTLLSTCVARGSMSASSELARTGRLRTTTRSHTPQENHRRLFIALLLPQAAIVPEVQSGSYGNLTQQNWSLWLWATAPNEGNCGPVPASPA